MILHVAMLVLPYAKGELKMHNYEVFNPEILFKEWASNRIEKVPEQIVMPVLFLFGDFICFWRTHGVKAEDLPDGFLFTSILLSELRPTEFVVHEDIKGRKLTCISGFEVSDYAYLCGR
jgi:hypothetical protein